jgi:hypothetical protein
MLRALPALASFAALALAAAAPVLAQAPDFTSRLELLGNPLTARWGAANTGAKVINTLEPYQGRLLIGSGDTATNTSIDVWSFAFDRQTFDLEQRIRQELVIRFREFNGKMYVNNEDLGVTGANINILDGTTWTRRDIILPNNQPFDSFAVEHSRDVYLWDGKLLSSNGNRNGYPHLVVSENDGVTWRVARGGPMRGADGSSQEPLHFFVVQGQLYVMPWSDSTPIFRYTPGTGDEFVVAHATYSAAGFPHIANQLYQRRSVTRDGVAYYHTFHRLYAIHQMEPTLDLREFNNFPGLTVNETTVRVQDFHFTADGRLRALLSQTITSGANQYFNRARVFESANNGQSWTELFNALCPGPRLLFARFASQGDEFFLTTNFDYFYADGTGVPTRLGGTDGNVYRISLAATGRPRATPLSFARIALSWLDQTSGAATGWEVQRAPASADTWQTLATLPAATLSLEDAGLDPATTYRYRVRALYAGGAGSDWSTPSLGTTGPAYFLAPQADSGVEGSTLRGANATMNVKQVGNRKAYLRFDVRDLAEDLRHAELRVTFTQLDWDSTDLANGLNFRLYGLNPGSTAGGGKLGEDWPEMEINWDNAPANNTSSGTDLLTGAGTENGGRAQLLLTINVPSSTVNGATLVFTGPELVAFLNSVRAAGRPSATLALTRANGASGSNSTFATKENGTGSAHPRLVVVPQSVASPTTPVSGLSVTAVTSGAASLAWQALAADGLSGYQIQRRLLPDGAWLDLGSVSTINYTDGALAAGSGYAYRVRPVTLLGPGPWSGSVLAVTPAVPGPPYGVVAHWPFTETAGSTAADASGQGRALTFSSAPTWPDDAARGRVVNLAGSTQVASVPNEAAFNAMGALTIAFWVRPSNLNGADPRFVVSKRTGTTDGVFSVFFFTGNRLFIDLDTTNNRFSSSTVFANDTWYHVALVFDGSLPSAQRARLYVNGVLDTTATESSAVLNTNTAPVWIGQPNTSATNQFNGRLSQLRIHRHAFPAESITDLMGGTLPPPPAPYGTLESWRQRHFSAAQLADSAVSGPTASPAGDGVPNLLKYALGLDPLVRAAPAALPRLETSPSGDVLTLAYQRARYAPDVSAAVQWSETLSAWSTAGVVEEIVSRTDTHEEVEAHVARDARPRLFLRLRAAAP